MESRYVDRRLSRTKRALENHGFKVFIALTREDAVRKVLGLIPA